MTIELRCGGSDLTTAEENALHHLALIGARWLEASHRLGKGLLIDVTNGVIIAAIGISGLTVVGGNSDSGALMSKQDALLARQVAAEEVLEGDLRADQAADVELRSLSVNLVLHPGQAPVAMEATAEAVEELALLPGLEGLQTSDSTYEYLLGLLLVGRVF